MAVEIDMGRTREREREKILTYLAFFQGKGTIVTHWLSGEHNPEHPDFAPKDSC